MYDTIFCQKTKVLAAKSNLRVEQNLVHLGRFLHFSQKVVGVTLSNHFTKKSEIVGEFFSPALEIRF